MKLIYLPSGAAREYSPLALNHYSSCSHGCSYCYATRFPLNMDNHVARPRKGVSALGRQLETGAPIRSQVLLSFMGDPYCIEEQDLRHTRKVLEILNSYMVPAAILTKGGERCLYDIDLFRKYSAPLKVGATLTFVREEDSMKYEPGAALPEDRFDTLRILHENGVATWASLEPVIDPEQTLKIIAITHEHVDHFMVGKLNHAASKTNWTAFGNVAVRMLRNLGKKFYIKNDLAPYITERLEPCERDMDALTLRTER